MNDAERLRNLCEDIKSLAAMIPTGIIPRGIALRRNEALRRVDKLDENRARILAGERLRHPTWDRSHR